MADFRGTVQGMRGEASRLGSAKSGLYVRAAGWAGSVCARVTQRDGREYASVSLDCGNAYGSGGPVVYLYEGPIDQAGREAEAARIAERSAETGEDDPGAWKRILGDPAAAEDWRYEVANQDTVLGFDEWCRNNGRTLAEKEA